MFPSKHTRFLSVLFVYSAIILIWIHSIFISTRTLIIKLFDQLESTFGVCLLKWNTHRFSNWRDTTQAELDIFATQWFYFRIVQILNSIPTLQTPRHSFNAGHGIRPRSGNLWHLFARQILFSNIWIRTHV